MEKNWAWTKDDFEIIRVLKQCIPVGARLVEAYETENEIIVCGEPQPEPEGLSEAEMAAWYETAHNCDAMGCGTLSHVIYRFDKKKPCPHVKQSDEGTAYCGLAEDAGVVLSAIRRVIHTNECSDEAGWFAFWQLQPNAYTDEDFSNRVNGCESEAEAIEQLLRQEYARINALRERAAKLEKTITDNGALLRAVAEILDGYAHHPNAEPNRQAIHDIYLRFTEWVRDAAKLVAARDAVKDEVEAE